MKIISSTHYFIYFETVDFSTFWEKIIGHLNKVKIQFLIFKIYEKMIKEVFRFHSISLDILSFKLFTFGKLLYKIIQYQTDTKESKTILI